MLKTAKSYVSGLFHLLFPHTCMGCHTEALPNNQVLCVSCSASLPVTNLFSTEDNELERQFYGRVELKRAGAAFFFTKHSVMQQLFFALKYKGAAEVGTFLGKKVADEIKDNSLWGDVDVIVPLPLNERKQRIRGYNQAELIAAEMSRQLSLPLLTKAVVRTTYTHTQTHKDRLHRWQTMSGVFVVANEKQVAGKHVLLVDDIVTTGATLESCAHALRQVEGTSVSVACAAWTI